MKRININQGAGRAYHLGRVVTWLFVLWGVGCAASLTVYALTDSLGRTSSAAALSIVGPVSVFAFAKRVRNQRGATAQRIPEFTVSAQLLLGIVVLCVVAEVFFRASPNVGTIPLLLPAIATAIAARRHEIRTGEAGPFGRCDHGRRSSPWASWDP